ncbi:MAG: glycosyltransferase [Thermodesulfobacteriota bacterium]
MTEPIRILRIIARLNIGGPAIQAVSLSARLPGNSYRTLLVCGKVGTHEGDMSYLGFSEGIRPLFLPGLGREISAIRDPASLNQLRRVMQEFRPHIVHTHTAKAGTLGRLAGISLNLAREARRRIRLVHTFHGHVFRGYFSPWKSLVFILIERSLARFTDRIIVISPHQHFDICRRFRISHPGRVEIIPLGFDLEGFRDVHRHRESARSRLLGNAGANVRMVSIIGRLTPIKNHRMLFQAVKCLRDWGRGGSLRFLLVGDGELREDLAASARDLGIEDQVIFAGWQKDMAPVYGASDLVALTSLNEGTPVALIEAMAAGVPVIATQVGGVPDLLGRVESGLNEGYGLAPRGMLVRSGDAEGLARGLLFAVENGAKLEEARVRAQDYVHAQYKAERLVKDMDELYVRLLSKPFNNILPR